MVRADAARVVREYDRLAPRYDDRWQHYIRATTEATAAHVELPAGGTLLDVGCGTGALLLALVGRSERATLVGIDPSGEMLSIARSRLTGDIRLEQGYAEELPFDDHQFDSVVSNSVFHYFASPATALDEIRRVLRPGGQLILTDWCDDYLACKLCDRWLRWVDPAHTRIFGSRECLERCTTAGFVALALHRFKINWLWGLMSLVARSPGA